MGSSQSTSSVPLHIQRRIDATCQKFEEDWKLGLEPNLEEFLVVADENWRNDLLRELLAIEHVYRTNVSGQKVTLSEICEYHAELGPEIRDAWNSLRTVDSVVEDAGQTLLKGGVTPRDPDATIEHQTKKRESHGLHIRCPHCSNPVELLNDTPYENIICRTCGSAFSLVEREGPTAEIPPLQKLARFEILARLGVGGFGTVWKARDTELDRAVAIKIPRKGQLDRMEAEQFLREARTAAQLRHPNIVPVHEVGRDGETIFIVSDLVRGVSLSDWLSGGPPSFRMTAELMLIIAEALHHAHQKGVIHRDLKPSNILIDEQGKPYLMDFGLAKREVGEITMTVDGQILGTPAYMSPEQAEGKSQWIDCRADIYSFGVVLFRMLTGELPFRGNSQMQIHQRLTKDPPDPRSLNRFIPNDLSTICLKCLEHDPNRRYSTALDLADEFARYLRGEPILSRPISGFERTLRWTKRKPAIATAAMMTLVLAIAGPLTATTIYYQKHRLAQLLAEKNNLIDKYAGEKEHDASKIDELAKQLDVWEGRANPWEFWPPKRDQPPRLMMSKDFFAHASAQLLTQLQNGKVPAEDAARGYLALAMTADATGDEDDAANYYQRAHDELVVLAKKNPDATHCSLALAQCDVELARLTLKTDRAGAIDYVAKAIASYRQLAAAHKSDQRYQIDWLESEMTSATLAAPDAAQDHLTRVSDIDKSLSAEWPTDPTASYRLACYLTGHEPLLLTPESMQPSSTRAP